MFVNQKNKKSMSNVLTLLSSLLSLLSMTTMLFDLTAALNKPLLKQNNVPIPIMMIIAFSRVQRSGFGSHHNYCDKISCFQLINRVYFDLSSLCWASEVVPSWNISWNKREKLKLNSLSLQYVFEIWVMSLWLLKTTTRWWYIHFKMVVLTI